MKINLYHFGHSKIETYNNMSHKPCLKRNPSCKRNNLKKKKIGTSKWKTDGFVGAVEIKLNNGGELFIGKL